MSSDVYTGGTFDLFHSGHVRLLARCRDLAGGGLVWVGLNTDEFVTEYKGHPPVISFAGRMEVLAACRYVDRVIPNFGGRDSKPAILEAQPDLIVVGSDWTNRNYDEQLDVTPEWLAKRGIEVLYTPYTEGISSSQIREAL